MHGHLSKDHKRGNGYHRFGWISSVFSTEGLLQFPVDVITTMMQPNRNVRPRSIIEIEQLLQISIHEQ